MFTNNDSGNGRDYAQNLDAAQVIANFITPSSPSRVSPQAPRAQPGLIDFASVLEGLASQNDEIRQQLEQQMARIAREYLSRRDLASPSTEEFVGMLRSRSMGTSRGGTVARAFWWGFHIEVSHEDLVVALATGDTVNTLVQLIGGSIPSPAQPFIVLAAQFVAAAIGLVRSLDRGRGVYISMSWFAPGVFIPTSV